MINGSARAWGMREWRGRRKRTLANAGTSHHDGSAAMAGTARDPRVRVKWEMS
jgi:hypothetical protein